MISNSSRVLGIPVLIGIIFLGGCETYTVPGRGADFRAMGLASPALSSYQRDRLTDSGISEALAKKPLAAFPTAIAVVRVQAANYHSETANGWGDGTYSIVFDRDVETPEQLDRFSKLPMINGVVALNPLLLPGYLHGGEDLRDAAAQLHADMLLIYTLDTTFHNQEVGSILTLVSLGAAPNQHITVSTTASAILVDTRNGYIYGVAEVTEHRDNVSMAWFTDAAIDGDRRQTESAAFDKLVDKLQQT